MLLSRAVAADCAAAVLKATTLGGGAFVAGAAAGGSFLGTAKADEEPTVASSAACPLAGKACGTACRCGVGNQVPSGIRGIGCAMPPSVAARRPAPDCNGRVGGGGSKGGGGRQPLQPQPHGRAGSLSRHCLQASWPAISPALSTRFLQPAFHNPQHLQRGGHASSSARYSGGGVT